MLLPPTITTLREVMPFASADEVLAAAALRDRTPIMPTVSRRPDGSVHLEWPL